MALPDLTGQNIEDTYQRLVHTDGADNYFTGDGTSIDLGATDISALNIFTGSAETSLTALNSWTGSYTFLSSSEQIGTEISGAIDTATGSLLSTYTFLSSSEQIASDISGSWQGQSVISSSMTSSMFVSHSLSSSVAVKLATSRTIGGTQFNGTANIIPLTTNVTTDSGDAIHYVPFLDGQTGGQRLKTDGGIRYNPAQNTLYVTEASIGNVVGATGYFASASSGHYSGHGNANLFSTGSNNADLVESRIYALDAVNGGVMRIELADHRNAQLAQTMLMLNVKGGKPNFLHEGFATFGDFTGLKQNAPIYLSAQGRVSQHAPSGSGDTARVVGYCVDASNRTIYFNPAGRWVET